jgi:hypothetical protein
LNEAGYSFTSLGRFKAGLFQKIGGWERFYHSQVSGIPRALHAWQDLNLDKHLLVGSNQILGVITDDTLNTVTPQNLESDFAPDFTTSIGSASVEIDDPNIANVTIFDAVYFNTPISVGGLVLFGLYPIQTVTGVTTYTITASANATGAVTSGGAVPEFTTVSGSSTVSVALDDHGLVAGEQVDFPVSTDVGGVTISGTYTVLSVIDVDNFTITANTVATSSTSGDMNGGDCQLNYYITLGPPAAGAGWGTGAYGDGGYGTGIVGTAQTGNPITASDWSFDNFGALGIAIPENGGLYYYDPSGGFENVIFVAEAPPFNGGGFVAMPQQQIILWASSTEIDLGEVQDPLLVRWCDVSNFFQWIASTTNQAGSYRLSTGSRIIGGLQGPQYAILWTDLDCWAMQYIGGRLVYGFNKVGSNCGLISSKAAATIGGQVLWMGQSNFYSLTSSGANPLNCTCWDAVFQDLDLDNAHKIRAGGNSVFNEVWWHYPTLSGGSGENDAYVKVNLTEGTWDNGPLQRTAWIDQNVFGNPIAANANGLIYQHEKTNDRDGSPINSVMQTGYWQLSEGQEIVFVDWILPDFRWSEYQGDENASLQVTIYATNYPGDAPQTFGPYNVTKATPYINVRIRARYMAINVQSSDLGSFWRLGAVKYRWAQDGRR